MRPACSITSPRQQGHAAFPRRLASALASALLAATSASAAPAGSDIANIAQIDVVVDGAPRHLSSNTVHIRLGELLDVRLTPIAPQPEQVAPGDTGHVSPFLLTNGGNGDEGFTLSAAVAGFDATIAAIWIDANGNGRFEPTADTRVADGGASPPLAPGASVAVFILSDVARAAPRGATGTVTLTATATTGNGTPGANFPAAGDGGGDAVVGATTARATAEARLVVSDMGATLIKSQAVATPGGGQPGRGSIVTYTLEARFTAAVTDARVADPLPPGTTYVAGSLSLDGGALSDAADGDAGAFDMSARTVSVALGNAAPATARTISFQVQIN